MATKTNFPDGAAEMQPSAQPLEMFPIEEHRARLGVSKPVFAGVCAANGWKPGRVMSEADFCLAVKERDGFRQARLSIYDCYPLSLISPVSLQVILKVPFTSYIGALVS